MKYRDLTAVEEVDRDEMTKIVGGATDAPGPEIAHFAREGAIPDIFRGIGIKGLVSADSTDSAPGSSWA